MTPAPKRRNAEGSGTAVALLAVNTSVPSDEPDSSYDSYVPASTGVSEGATFGAVVIGAPVRSPFRVQSHPAARDQIDEVDVDDVIAEGRPLYVSV